MNSTVMPVSRTLTPTSTALVFHWRVNHSTTTDELAWAIARDRPSGSHSSAVQALIGWVHDNRDTPERRERKREKVGQRHVHCTVQAKRVIYEYIRRHTKYRLGHASLSRPSSYYSSRVGVGHARTHLHEYCWKYMTAAVTEAGRMTGLACCPFVLKVYQ